MANINVKSNRHSHQPFKLVRYFEETGLNKKLIKEIKKCEIRLPSPIQMQAIPLSLKWKDLIGIAPTGSGKTLAFLIPLINFLLTMPSMNSERAVHGPYAIVLGDDLDFFIIIIYIFLSFLQTNQFNWEGPTRELVLQLKEEYDRIGKRFGLKSEALVGGRSLSKQESTLNQKGVETVFGTVGRTKDAIESSMLVLNQCYYVIVDEADSMFSLDLIGNHFFSF